MKQKLIDYLIKTKGWDHWYVKRHVSSLFRTLILLQPARLKRMIMERITKNHRSLDGTKLRPALFPVISTTGLTASDVRVLKQEYNQMTTKLDRLKKLRMGELGKYLTELSDEHLEYIYLTLSHAMNDLFSLRLQVAQHSMLAQKRKQGKGV